MPEAPKPFLCSREIELPATPSEVWRAVATTEGNTAWLFPNEIDLSHKNSIWDPPHHFLTRQESGPWFNQLDFVITEKSPTVSHLQYSHAGIFFENGDINSEAVQQHTDFYLHTLKQYLTHFKNQKALYLGGGPGGLQGSEASKAKDGFLRVKSALGLPEVIAVNGSYVITPVGLTDFEGIVDYNEQNFLGIRTNDALYRFFGRNAFGGAVDMSAHIYREIDDIEALTKKWQDWLSSI